MIVIQLGVFGINDDNGQEQCWRRKVRLMRQDFVSAVLGCLMSGESGDCVKLDRRATCNNKLGSSDGRGGRCNSKRSFVSAV